MSEATLYIDLSSSKCGACNLNADPRAETHEFEYGYGAASEMRKTGVRPLGCGATFTSLSSNYMGTRESCEEMRPDLPWVGYDR